MLPAVFVISLPDSINRRKKIEHYLNKLNIRFEIIDAIDGRFGLPICWEQLINREKYQKGSKLTDPVFACALSHIKVYQRIVNENLDFALVLEDDAIPQQDLIPYLVNEYYKDADLTQLFFVTTRVYRFSNRNLFGLYKSWLRHPPLEINWSSWVCDF